jgi:hypothetical protein
MSPNHVGSPIGGKPEGDGGSGWHVPPWHPSPARQSLLVLHGHPTSPGPSGKHSAVKPTIVHRSPAAQSASLLQDEPFGPLPPGVQVRPAPQYDPAWHSSLIVHIVPLPTHPQGAHLPAVHVRPSRQSFADEQDLPVLPGAGPMTPASVASVTPP